MLFAQEFVQIELQHLVLAILSIVVVTILAVAVVVWMGSRYRLKKEHWQHVERAQRYAEAQIHFVIERRASSELVDLIEINQGLKLALGIPVEDSEYGALPHSRRHGPEDDFVEEPVATEQTRLYRPEHDEEHHPDAA